MADTTQVVLDSRQTMRHCAESSSSSAEKGTTKRKSTSLPAEAVEYLKAWMMSPEHVAHPYPTEQEKAQIMADTGIELKQLTNWFVNNRKRYWKPRVEARLQQQAQAEAAAAAMVSRQNSGMNDTSRASHTLQQPFVTLDMAQYAPHRVMPPTLIGDHHRAIQPHHAFHHFNHNEKNEARTGPPVNLQHHQHPENTHAVSIGSASSLSSESDNASLGEDDDNNTATMVPPIVSMRKGEIEVLNRPPNADDVEECGRTVTVTCHEVIDVHVLRPSEANSDEEPSLEDVTILPNIPMDRIIKSYNGCQVYYSFPQDIENNTKKVQSRRDSEVVRIKKQCLRMYLAETQTSTGHSEDGSTKRPRAVSDSDGLGNDQPTNNEGSNKEDISSPKRIRTASGYVALIPDDSPRMSFRGKSSELWRDACRNARHVYDDGLPTLEEAAHLFGYAA